MPQRESLSWEKELIGAYVSEHPVTKALADLQSEITHTSGELNEDLDGQKAVMVGAVVSTRTIQTKKGDTMGFIQLEDVQGGFECVAFPRTWKQTQNLWQKDKVVLVRGTIDGKGKVAKILLDSATDKPQVTSAVPDKKGSGIREQGAGNNGQRNGVQPQPANGQRSVTNGQPQSKAVKENSAAYQAAAKPVTQPAKVNGQPPVTTSPTGALRSQPPKSKIQNLKPEIVEDFEVNEVLFDEDPFAGEIFIPDADDPIVNVAPVEDYGSPKHDNPLAESTAEYQDQLPLSRVPPAAPLSYNAALAHSAPSKAAEPVLKKNGNGNGNGKNYISLEQPYRFAKVVISRSGDSSLDASRVGEVHHLLASYPGPDRFCFLIKARGETLQLDFPNDTTTLDDMLIAQLKDLHGVESVQVSMGL